MDHLFFNLFELDPENEEDSIFMVVLNDATSKHGMKAMALLEHEELYSTYLSVPIRMAVEVNSLQFYLKNFQEKGTFSIDGSFDYSSIDESAFRNYINHPTSILQISSGIDDWPIPLPSRKCSLKDFSSNKTHMYPSS